MSFLIDTHIFLWWLADDSALKPKARKVIENENHLIFVSVASIWEIIIKKSLGKLQAPDDLESALKLNNMKPLPMELTHVLAIKNLPMHHFDPFDRMLIAQAKCESLTLITSDEKIVSYDLNYMKI